MKEIEIVYYSYKVVSSCTRWMSLSLAIRCISCAHTDTFTMIMQTHGLFKSATILCICQYLECFIFIREEFKFRWRCYKHHKSSTDMYMYYSCYQSTNRLYQSTRSWASRLILWYSRLGPAIESWILRVHYNSRLDSWYSRLILGISRLMIFPSQLIRFQQFPNTVLFLILVWIQISYFSEVVLI